MTSRLVARLASHPVLARHVVHHRRLPPVPARHGCPEPPLPRSLEQALAAEGIQALYTHQVEALQEARAGRNVIAVTPTASGKTLVFALPVLETLERDPEARALLLYPTKALAQDQLAGFLALARALRPLRPPRFEIYDGDTPAARRRKIKADPPEVLLTNPDMLHLGILAHHAEWEPFLRRLRWVVLDELHVYRGVFGSHVHHILRRLRRLCRAAGAEPRFLAASATVGNAERFAATLVGEPFAVVAESGAPRAAREFLFLNPVMLSPYTAALHVLREALDCGLRTIVFTKARRVAELLSTWLARQAPEHAARVAAYRAGYLPEERRDIEARLFRGSLQAVIATSALELGIDVGGLDVCVLVGYPGSRISTWQRLGRVGRQDREALVVLVALPDALDQYIVSHPQTLFDGAFEHAVLDPWNPLVSGAHLVCAAAERPLERDELLGEPRALAVAAALTEAGRLRLDAGGRRWFAFRRRPQRDVHPRCAGEPFRIFELGTGRMLGSVDAMRVYHECHPGAIYLHRGRTYEVRRLAPDERRVDAVAVRADHYTVVLGEKETEILERLEAGALGRCATGYGRLRVTVRVRAYQKRRLFGGEPIAEHPLQSPPLVFETTGLWLELPPNLPAWLGTEGLDFRGGIHAAEHAMIALFPLLAIADRGDVGGISYPLHPQLERPAIFLYDGVPGGAGLARQAFEQIETLLARTREHVSACPCQEGCPACIQSPKCGNGNKPLDKAAALRVLDTVLSGAEGEALWRAAAPRAPAPGELPASPRRLRRRHGITRAVPTNRSGAADEGHVLVFDLETQRAAAEVGGWRHAARMGLALAVVYDARRAAYRTYFERDVDRLLLDLAMADRVVGYNIARFDLRVLSGYTSWDLGRIRYLDLLEELRRRLGFRLSLAHLAEVNLGRRKLADGLRSLEWWREGRVDLVERYCREDVEVTRALYELGRQQGYLLYRDGAQRLMRVPAPW